ncbi:MAG: hypothetical protein K2X27_25990 [Candidatus Obscuribacterales bacterium]|nr:hypothetical protein [Candidatus Obscuribacterales bacterium]
MDGKNPESAENSKGANAQPEQEDKLLNAARVEISTPSNRAATTASSDRDPYSFHQNDKAKDVGSKPSEILIKDPYAFNQGDRSQDKSKPQLDPDLKKDLDSKLAAFKKELADNNFTINIEPKEGPWGSLKKARQDALDKQKSGAELSPQEKALAKLTDDEMLKESRRMRDRDFQTMKTEDGKARHFYSKNDHPSRYSGEEIDKMMQAKEQTLLQEAVVAQQKLEQTREAEKHKEAMGKLLDEAVEKHVPSMDQMSKAQAASGFKSDDLAQMRDRLKAVVKSEVEQGSLKPEDLQKIPRVGAVFVASGAVSQEEFNAALDEQKRLKQENKGPVPRLGDMIRSKLSPDRQARFDETSKFYDELKKLMEQKPEQKAQK